MASVAIIGAGITGLTAAFCLKQRGTSVVIYEATDRVGGVIRSERQSGYIADLGPSSMAAPTAGTTSLLSELGLDASIVHASAEVRTRYIVRRGKLVRLPLAPAELLTSRLLSNTAKLAVCGEPAAGREPLPYRVRAAGLPSPHAATAPHERVRSERSRPARAAVLRGRSDT